VSLGKAKHHMTPQKGYSK